MRTVSAGVVIDTERDGDMSDEIEKLVQRFLTWPLPYSVCADLCATKQQSGRTGTNLLSAVEAEQMLEHVLSMTATNPSLLPGIARELADRIYRYGTDNILMRSETDLVSTALRAYAERGGVGLSVREADVIAAAVQLVPLLEAGWDEQDAPEDQNEGSRACDALIAAVNKMLSDTSTTPQEPKAEAAGTQEKDAGRYRWIRENGDKAIFCIPPSGWKQGDAGPPLQLCQAKELDEVIDVHIAALKSSP